MSVEEVHRHMRRPIRNDPRMRRTPVSDKRHATTLGRCSHLFSSIRALGCTRKTGGDVVDHSYSEPQPFEALSMSDREFIHLERELKWRPVKEIRRMYRNILHKAAESSNFRVMNKLLDRDKFVDLNEQDDREYLTPLHHAARRGRYEMCAFLIDRGADVNRRAGGVFKWTVFQIVIQAILGALLDGDESTRSTDNDKDRTIPVYLRICELLLDNGVEDVNMPCYYGWDSDIHWACCLGVPKLVDMLINRGAIINAIDEKTECTPLHIAARYGYVDLCKTLLDRGALTEAYDRNGESPLHEAARGGFSDVCTVLISHGAYVNGKTERSSCTPLHLAACKGTPDIRLYASTSVAVSSSPAVEKLAAGVHSYIPNAPTVIMHDDLSFSSSSFSPPKLRRTHGDNVTTTTTAATVGQTTGSSGTMVNYLETARVLCYKGGADVNARDAHGFVPLHYAAQCSFLELCEMLLVDFNADVNIVNGGQTAGDSSVGDQPLHLAIRANSVEICRLLLNWGAGNTNKGEEGALGETNKGGSSPLILATILGHIDIAELLLDRGFDVDVSEASSGLTSLHIAAEQGVYDFCVLLLKHNASVNNPNPSTGITPLLAAARGGNVEICELLVKHGADHGAKDAKGTTAIHFACSQGFTDVCNMLIDKGYYDVNESGNEHHTTPLHLASAYCHYDLCVALLARGACINSKDYFGCTPLHYACSYGFSIAKGGEDLLKERRAEVTGESFLDICSLLLQHHADVNAVNNAGDTPLYFAAFYALNDALVPLLELGADPNIVNDDQLTPMLVAEGGKMEAALHTVNSRTAVSSNRSSIYTSTTADISSASPSLVKLSSTRSNSGGILSQAPRTLPAARATTTATKPYSSSSAPSSPIPSNNNNHSKRFSDHRSYHSYSNNNMVDEVPGNVSLDRIVNMRDVDSYSTSSPSSSQHHLSSGGRSGNGEDIRCPTSTL